MGTKSLLLVLLRFYFIGLLDMEERQERRKLAEARGNLLSELFAPKWEVNKTPGDSDHGVIYWK